MVRLACLLVLAAVPACAPVTSEKPDPGYAGTVQKVYPVTLQGKDVPGIRLLGKVGSLLGPKLRQSGETNQYVIRTRTGQIMAQSDEEFAVGECIEVIPQSREAYGPAYHRSQAKLVKSNNCTTLAGGPKPAD